jgi:hypothetical protein
MPSTFRRSEAEDEGHGPKTRPGNILLQVAPC